MQEGPVVPDEIWERIFSHLFELGPDRSAVSQTCRRFRRIITQLNHRQKRAFEKRLGLNTVQRLSCRKLKIATPSKRCSHASCMLNGKLYVFGGYSEPSAETAFADLWRFEPTELRYSINCSILYTFYNCFFKVDPSDINHCAETKRRCHTFALFSKLVNSNRRLSTP